MSVAVLHPPQPGTSPGLSSDPADAALIEAVEQHMAGVVDGYSAGPLRDMARYHLASGGRRFRARLVLSALRALETDVQRGVPFAAAVELLHNATLVHDDLQDGDRVRRGRPATWALFGANQAINTGDLLLMLPTLALMHGYRDVRLEPELCWHLNTALSERASLTACGQAAELQLNERGAHDWHAWWAAAAGKTGHLFALPIQGALLLAGATPQQAQTVADAVVPLGVLFQVQDDVLDLYGDKGRGRRGNDLREGKVSALTAAHLACAPGDGAWVAAQLSVGQELTDGQVSDVAARFALSGALDNVRERSCLVFDRVESDPALLRHPRLHRELLACIRQILAPLLCAASGP